MKLERIITELAYVMEIDSDSLTATTELEKFSNWDSLAIVSTIALIDQEFGVLLDGAELSECRTLNEIFNLATQKKNAA